LVLPFFKYIPTARNKRPPKDNSGIGHQSCPVCGRLGLWFGLFGSVSLCGIFGDISVTSEGLSGLMEGVSDDSSVISDGVFGETLTSSGVRGVVPSGLSGLGLLSFGVCGLSTDGVPGFLGLPLLGVEVVVFVVSVFVTTKVFPVLSDITV
jgi:hypothetical protein